MCRALKATIDNFAELQYLVELGADGMIHCPTNLSTADCLNLLVERRRAWAQLDWKQCVSVDMPGACQAYELVGGVFAKTMSIAGETGGSRNFLASWLPSRHNSGHLLEHKDVGLLSRDFAIDPTQDLIAFVVFDHDA